MRRCDVRIRECPGLKRGAALTRGRDLSHCRKLRVSSNRIAEKRYFETTGVAVGPYREVRSPDNLKQAIAELRLPGVLKSCSGGYDGKGQLVLRAEADVAQALAWVKERHCIYEAFVAFDRGASRSSPAARVRASFGPTRSPRTRTRRGCSSKVSHLRTFPKSVETQARRAARKVAERLGYVGVFAIEFFDVGGKLLANEMRPASTTPDTGRSRVLTPRSSRTMCGRFWGSRSDQRRPPATR